MLSRYILHAEYAQSFSTRQSRQRSAAPAGLKTNAVLPLSPSIVSTSHQIFAQIFGYHNPPCFLLWRGWGIQKMTPSDTCKLKADSSVCGPVQHVLLYGICSACVLLFLADYRYLRAPAQWCIRSMSWHDLANRENELSASFLQFPRTNEWAKW